MRDTVRNSSRVAGFDEWRKRFLNEAKKDGYAWNTLKEVTRSEPQRQVVLELLFHHVMGNYGFGANPRDWEAFSNELESLCRRALALADEFARDGYPLDSGRSKMQCGTPRFEAPRPQYMGVT